jgi:hypothetical protein
VTRKEWVRRRTVAALCCLGLGFALVVVGSLIAWGRTPLLGYGVGSLGILLVVMGALFGRQALAGPFPPEAT